VLSLVSETAPVPLISLTVQQKPSNPTPERLALHYRLLGAEPGSEPLQARKAAEQILRTFLRSLPAAVEAADFAPLMTLTIARPARRPLKRRVKLPHKAVLAGPDHSQTQHRSGGSIQRPA
jgi:hypothetical protein